MIHSLYDQPRLMHCVSYKYFLDVEEMFEVVEKEQNDKIDY